MFDRTKKFWKYRRICLKFKKNKIVYTFFLLLCRIINRRLNAGIPIDENINEFVAPHGLSGIYISKKAKIEEGCTIFQQVTIGSNTLPDSKNAGAPNIRKKCLYWCWC